uniref:protein-serine/threonine phosphatase n=1 Tax=Knipowitschia caucasica TaxID=637954 RepID=A0AAV2J4K4_KNICA
MTLGAVSSSESSSAISFCACCGEKMMPYFSEDAVVNKNQINQLISESFLTVKGAALFLPRGNSPTPNSTPPRLSQRHNKHTGDLQKHLQTMFTVLRPEDTIRLAVRLETAFPQVTRYMVVVSTNGRQDTEESIVLGMDFVSSDSCCSVGLVLPLWSDTLIHLDGDGGFSVSTVNRVHVFKPVSVQAMWSALQSLHKACEVARCHNYYPGSLFLTWVSYYQSRISSSQVCVNEWNAMQDVESHRASSPVLFTDLPTERERTERLIKMRLREIMMQKDLENVTCKEIRTELEMQMVCNLREFKGFIDNEMIVILGQMDSPTEIFDHVFLGSEWNASNLDELQNSGVQYILNVTREIDNFFPGLFEYHNIRVYDEEATNLLEYWNETYKFITKAKKAGGKCLVHCKMGISRSASTVIAYAMKEYNWDLDTALDYVKDKRSITKPNPSFMKQLEEYQGILLASKQRHNKLWRSHSDGDLSDATTGKPAAGTLMRSDSHNNSSGSILSSPSSPSLHHFLQALASDPPTSSSSSPGSQSSDEGDPANHEESRAPDTLPLPQAATVVPEDAAVTVPIALPHPPPSVHILPSTPKMQHAQLAGTHHANPVPKLSLDLPRKCSLEDSSPQTCGSTDSDIRDLSDLTSGKVTPISPVVLAPGISPNESNDDNNNPSHLSSDGAMEGRGEADGSSTHSTDRIDFFSAREKFLGLAQDGRPQKQAEQGTNSTLPSPTADENKEPEAKEDGITQKDDHQFEDCSPPADNCISVRHIVTEIEAITHPASSPSTITTSASSPSLLLLLPPAEPHPESGVEPAPISPLHTASMLSSEWPIGSVRRATKQLEQKLKQEMLATSPRSPLHSPSNESPLARALQADECSDAQGEDELPNCSDGTHVKMIDTSDFADSSQDVEARLRQAGLTPPSLMKRSASLAKLDSLELSANDLNHLDLTSRTKILSHSRNSQFYADDTWKKKQKVLAHLSRILPLSSNQNERDEYRSCCQKEDECDGVEFAHKQGKGHSTSSRHCRKISVDKKHRAVTVLYNTM